MIEYRDAVAADGPEIDAMAQVTWLATFGHGCSKEDADAYLAKAYGPNGQLIADLAKPEVDFHIARAEGEVIGYAKLNPPWLPDAEAGALQLSQIYVAADWQGKGVAQVLLAWAIERARTRGAGALLLTVWEENHRAKRFYERQGFVHIGDYDFAVGQQVDRDLVMRLAL